MPDLIPIFPIENDRESLRFRSLFSMEKSGPAVRCKRSTGPDRNHLSQRCIMALIRIMPGIPFRQVNFTFERKIGGVA
jgi:hypothetical protein